MNRPQTLGERPCDPNTSFLTGVVDRELGMIPSNGDAERFVLVTADRRAVYVNRRAVVRALVSTEDSPCR